MTQYTVIHDLHIGALRSAGTTPTSALELRRFGLDQFRKILSLIDSDLIILGDLFDTHSIPMSDLLAAYMLLVGWLDNGRKLYLVPGNHDLSTDTSKMSSFQFLGRLLTEQSNAVSYVDSGRMLPRSVYVIPHVANQDLLDMQLAAVPECKYLLVHANYDNDFAKESDHSLNISEQQIDDCKAEVVFFAHEHYYRVAKGGKVFISGNQFPMSVSDCLHKEDKFMTVLADKPCRIQTWNKEDYAEIDWRNPVETEARFVRFVGHASAEESADMANAIARYRKLSSALIITNAVQVRGSDEVGEIEAQSLEDIKEFDVMAALKPFLTSEEIKTIESL